MEGKERKGKEREGKKEKTVKETKGNFCIAINFHVLRQRNNIRGLCTYMVVFLHGIRMKPVLCLMKFFS